MTYNQAMELCIKYAEAEHLDYKHKAKIQTDHRFRFDFNSIDISFDDKDSLLVVRACIERERAKRLDFTVMIDSLNIQHKDELAEGILEYDETALEVDGYKPNRLNIRLDFVASNIESNEFNAKVLELLTAAMRWRSKYYIPIYLELNKKLEKK